ncbi:MAG: hypothetical protein WED07_06735 [Candidatus Freyarchaeum deiterrae]
MKTFSARKEAIERNVLEKRDELPFTALEDDKLLGRHRVKVNVSWENDIRGKNKLNFFKGFPAKLYITESRLIISSEFYSQDKVSRFVGRIPIGWMRYNTVYVELAINKIKKASFTIFGSYIELDPHGNVGETKINFYNLSRGERRLIKEDLDTARVFKRTAPESGIVILDRPIADAVTQRFAMLRHEAIVSKPTSKKPEVKKATKVPIKRVSMKENADAGTAVEPVQSGIEEVKENAEKPSLLLENKLEKTPQERVLMTLQAQVTKCRFCGQEILRSAKKCPRCGAINL